LKIILVEDALYANAPHIRQITGYGWRYILNVDFGILKWPISAP